MKPLLYDDGKFGPFPSGNGDPAIDGVSSRIEAKTLSIFPPQTRNGVYTASPTQRERGGESRNDSESVGDGATGSVLTSSGGQHFQGKRSPFKAESLLVCVCPAI